MDELVVSDIDAQMADTAATGVEKNQIAGFQIAPGNRGTYLILFLAGTGKVDSVGAENVLHISAAIKA